MVQPFYDAAAPIPGELHSLLRQFARSPGNAADDIRALFDRDKRAFCADAIRHFRTFDGASPGGQFLVALLLERGLLVKTLCDATIDADHVRRVLTAALASRSDADVTLARAVVEAAQTKDTAISRDSLVRVLNILDGMADPNRVTPRLLMLLRHPDGHLRSKAVLMVGRCGKNVPWARRQLADPDARTRANAVEALWGRDDAEARELLHEAAVDSSSRVAGNALMGLYLAGEATSIGQLLAMAASPAPSARASAGWVMGNTGDRRFVPMLQCLQKDEHSLVRRVAATALKRIPEVEQLIALPQSPFWRAAAWRETAEPGPVRREIRVALQGVDGSEPPPIPHTQFTIADGGLVAGYQVEECAIPERLAIALVFPMAGDRPEAAAFKGAVRALAWKRPHDLWVLAPYSRAPHPLRATLLGEVIEIALPLGPHDPTQPGLLTDADAIAADLEAPHPATVRPGLWNAVCGAAAILRRANLQRTRLYIIACASDVLQKAPGSPIMTGFASEITLHVIAQTDDELLRQACRQTGGEYRLAAAKSEVPEALERAHLSLLAQYRISYESSNTAEACELSIRTPGGLVKVPIR